MAITDDLRKTLSDPTPLYFAAGTADLAIRQVRKVPSLVEQLRAQAPARIEQVRGTDPKVVQERATARAKEAQETIQTKVNGLIGNLDVDLKKVGEQAQDLALRGVGVAAEYAVKAREAYEKVAEHGEQAVKTWRGDAAEEIEELAIAVEGQPEPGVVKETPKPAAAAPAAGPAVAKPDPAAKKPVAKKPTPAPAPAAARKAPQTKKPTPPAK
ncbi:hypothetical protein ACIPPM_24970 [Streptomyces sp. NPDC090119]|uniref:hypothetical protein n=1 Tax=Streptomyces sp. NPDC090119 TaxID=3365951 RepID=UPI00381693DC